MSVGAKKTDDQHGPMMFAGASGDENPFPQDAELVASVRRLVLEKNLGGLRQLEWLYDDHDHALWTYMVPDDRPSFTLSMLDEFELWHRGIARSFEEDAQALRFLVLGSRCEGVFCYGGDLNLFVSMIESGDRAGLREYGHRCVRILHNNRKALGRNLLTIGLVQGDALGGGFEALLSFDFIVAEKGTKFGLPEVMFGLFPGMGAHSFLVRALGSVAAERLIMSGETFLAEELHEMGLVHVLAEKGQGVDATRELIRREGRRHAGAVGARRARKIADAVSLDELETIVNVWADTALQLRKHDLRIMQRLASAQQRQRARENGAQARLERRSSTSNSEFVSGNGTALQK